MTQLIIAGLGGYLPRNSVDNAHVPPLTQPLSVEEMDGIGVLRRGHASEDETVEMMGLLAAERALAAAGMAADELDFVIFVSWTTRRFAPDVAPRLQYALGANRAMAFDICCACSGFLQALSIARGYLLDPRYRSGLIVASDRSASHMRPGSRATLIFGDGAAAAVVSREGDHGIRLVDYEIRSDGANNSIMEVDADGYLVPHIRQRELNALAGRSMAGVSQALLDRAGVRLDEIDWIVPHSGTAGVQGMLRQFLEVPAERVLTTLPLHGNLAAAAIPCALRHFLDQGTITQGNRVLAAAVGLGWQCSAVLLELI